MIVLLKSTDEGRFGEFNKSRGIFYLFKTVSFALDLRVKFIYSEKATKFCEISTVDLTITTYDKSTVEISQKFVAFSEYMNFNI